MALPDDTIALPLVKGLNVQTDARLLDPPSLLEAENTQFSGGGAKKRRGHLGLIARGQGNLIPNKVINGAYAEATAGDNEHNDPFRFVITAKEKGVEFNGYTVQFVNDGTGAGTFEDGAAAVYHYDSGVTTVSDVIATAVSEFWDITLAFLYDGSEVLDRNFTATLAGGIDEFIPAWHFGAGLLSGSTRPVAEADTLYWSDPDPDIVNLEGVFTRDNETVVWDGFRLFSYLPSDVDAQAPRLANISGAAVMPSLRATPLVKQNEHQGVPDYAQNTLAKVVAWVDEDAVANYAILDLVSGAQKASGTLASGTVLFLRTFTLGDWMHIALLDSDSGEVRLFSINALEPNDITYRPYGPAAHFDIWKTAEDEAVLVRAHTDGIHVQWLSTTGTGSDTRTVFTFVPSVTTAQTQIAVTYDPQMDHLGIAWHDGTTKIGGLIIGADGSSPVEGLVSSTEVDEAAHMTISARGILTDQDSVPFVVFWNRSTTLVSKSIWLDTGAFTAGTEQVRYRKSILSRAFKIGDRVFLWAGHNSDAQSSWYLLDEGLLPVGHINFGTANVSGMVNHHVCGVNWLVAEPYKVHCAISSKLRTDSTDNLGAIYTEPFIQGVEIDFLPSLRSAQAGRSTYIAGAQLWAYDGVELVEAGFHMGPEPTLAVASGGNLTADGSYSYRIDLCHRNAQNEEVRSLSILTDTVNLSGGDKTINITIPTVITRREDSYFLIFRNAMSSGTPLTEWWLLNSRDPSDASFLLNDLTQDTVSYVDDGSIDDEEIQVRELHPATDTYLQPVAAPACEIIASGRDRLWLAGGELAPGVVAPSRLFDPGEIPSFNAYLAIQVDRAIQPITAIGFIGEIGAIFREESTHILDSDGPDNVANGFWNPPRLALTDLGAVSQESIARLSQGIIFQSVAGFRLLGPGGSLQPVGVDIDRAIKEFEVVGTVLNERDQEVRFYGEDGAYVFNYLYGTWAHWTCGGVGVAKNSNGYAVIVRQDGYLWIETPDIYTDATNTYTHRIRTSWLHGGNLGDFQRVRLIGGLGRFADTTVPEHNLRLELFYDEREFWEERIEWAMPDATVNDDTWGAGTWGSGVWGDTSATINNLEDLTWEWERKPARQKCAVFSVALEDYNTEGPGFELSALTFKLARKQGLNKTPERTGTGTQR